MKLSHRILAGLAILSMAAPLPVIADSTDGKNVAASESMSGSSDRKPGPAWKTIGGTVKHIKGDVYTVEDYEGNQVQLYVSRDTKHLRGNKKVGDRVRAEITRGGFANSIQ